MINPIPPQLGKVPTARISRSLGCGLIFLVLLSSIWVLILSGMDLFASWTFEQAFFESTASGNDVRWIVHLVYTIVLLVPLFPLFLAVKVPRLKLMFRLWVIGLVFSLCTTPIKLIGLTSQTEVFLSLAGILMLLSIGLRIVDREQETEQVTKGNSALIGPVIMAGAVLALPWILWGALGSIMDTLVVLFLGIMFGFFVSSSILPFYINKVQLFDQPVTTGQKIFDGFVVGTFLLIVTTGLGQNFSQSLLVFTIPVSGWLITTLAAAGQGRRDRGKLAVGLMAAFTLALPLLAFDPDELSLITSSSEGEVLQWAMRAGTYSLVFLLFTGFSLILVTNLLKRTKVVVSLRLDPWFAVLGILSVGLVYAFFGQTGFHGDRLFVVFKNQVEIEQSIKDLDLIERKVILYQSMTRTAQDSQVLLREKLNHWGIKTKSYYLVNALEVDGGLVLKWLLSRQASVDKVLDSPVLRSLPKEIPQTIGEVLIAREGTTWNLEMIHAPQVHEQLGVTGNGIVIGQTDSGAEGDHPELIDSYRGNGTSGDYNWLDPWYASQVPVDIGGHGTGTLGLEVGKTRGVAPGALWIGCVNLARNLGNPALYLDCMQFMFAPYPQGGDPFLDGDVTKAANIINNSWGCPVVEGCNPDVFLQAMKILKVAGIFMSTAAGNSGRYGCSTVSDPPAIYEDVFTAGAVNIDNQLSVFSSVGPVLVDGSNRQKPDILAPGEQILLAAPGGTYTFSSGTSFAAPHVTGVVALMWSANPALVGDIETTTRILLETAQPYNGTELECGNGSVSSGAGILDAYAAVQAAIAVK